jgi:BirA family biotin operon repressor/biotin-[acetyl-CoA-carboxylase] ligase
VYNLAELEVELAGTIFAGKLHFSPVTRSTNTDAMVAARNGAAHGTVFFADEQTAGRGRSDHSWHSAAGEGLYVSIVLRLQLPMERMALLPLAVGLAAAEAVENVSGLKVDLRWPNDLLMGRRKAGGILVEASTQAGGTAFAVVGIGINVHQKAFDPALDTPATSLDIETGCSVSRQKLLVALLKSLEREAHALEAAASAQLIPSRVEDLSTWLRGRRVHVHGPQACTGVTSGLDENGFLQVDTHAGRVIVRTGGIRAAEME